jgi:hypothetical protein
VIVNALLAMVWVFLVGVRLLRLAPGVTRQAGGRSRPSRVAHSTSARNVVSAGV